MDEYLTAKEAAAALGLKYSTLLARIRKKKIRAVKKGWSLFIHKDEIERVLNANH